MLRLRLLSALIFIPILVGAGIYGEPAVSLVVAVFVVLGLIEFYAISERAGYHPLTWLGYLFGVAIIGVLYLRVTFHVDHTLLLVTAATMTLLVARIFRPTATTVFADWAVTMAGAAYLGFLLGHWVPLRDLPMGREWAVLTLLSTFASDSGAFFAGRAFGKHLLAPEISPKKTWEGAVGALIATPAAVLGLNAILGLGASLGFCLVVGIVLSVAAQLGDLAESALKRAAQVKDAGEFIPGHGGALDRIDSLSFTATVVYYLVAHFGRS